MNAPKRIPGMLSVVVPIHFLYPELDRVRASIQRASTPVEVLLVTQEALKESLGPLLPRETLIVTAKQGRGPVLAEGVREAHGDIIVFVHADTILPDHWDHTIVDALRDEEVLGGGFSLSMDTPAAYLKLLIALTDFLYYVNGELWGDRALFVRSSFIRQHLTEIEIPMMEDVRLTLMMQRYGTVVLLKEKAVTSAATFRKYGFLRNSIRIILVRLWYGAGRDPKKIYEYYYRR